MGDFNQSPPLAARGWPIRASWVVIGAMLGIAVLVLSVAPHSPTGLSRLTGAVGRFAAVGVALCD